MSHIHTVVNPNKVLEDLRSAIKAWEGAKTHQEEQEAAESVTGAADILDRYLCNGGAFPDDWAALFDGLNVRKMPSREDVAAASTPTDVPHEAMITVDYGRPCCPHIYKAVDSLPPARTGIIGVVPDADEGAER